MILVLTKRRADTDFRQFLVRAFRAQGLACYRIDVKTRSVVQGPWENSGEILRTPLQLLRFLREVSRAEQCLILDSLNHGLPFFSALMRICAHEAVWVHDVHDDFLYDLTASQRLYARFGSWVHAAIASFSAHAAPALGEGRKSSHHLGNASHLTPRKLDPRRHDTVLIMASIDERFDFEVVGGIAASCDVGFDIYGGVSGGLSPERTEEIKGRLMALCANPRIAYRGAYDNAAIDTVLDGYSIMFAPYDVHSRSIRFIDPLRFYHCLNFGLEVISTRIPAVAHFPDVHVIDTPAEFGQVIQRIRAGTRPIRPSSIEGRSWDDKAARLLDLADRHRRRSQKKRADRV